MAVLLVLLSVTVVAWRLIRMSQKDEDYDSTVEVKCEVYSSGLASGIAVKEGQKLKRLFVSAGECYHTLSNCEGLRSAIRVRTLLTTVQIVQ
eukprot:6211091-Amphidinium_carterae.1